MFTHGDSKRQSNARSRSTLVSNVSFHLLIVTLVLMATLPNARCCAFGGAGGGAVAEDFFGGGKKDVSSGDDLVQKSTAPHIPHEYCCCSTKTVDENTGSMLYILNQIVQSPYFRYFKVDVKKACSYWAVSLLCQSADNPCQVCKCSADEVPFGLNQEPDMGCPAQPGGAPGLDRSLGSSGMDQDSVWGGAASGGVNSAALGFEDFTVGGDDSKEGGAEYIDLTKNPEGNTGYTGELANRIWESIYAENCFQGDQMQKTTQDLALDHLSSEQPQCKEQKFLYEIISGLHASISTHIAVRYHRGSESCGVNCAELKRRVLDHPDRVDNMYTLYLFLLRAMTRATDSYLGEQHLYPMDSAGTDDNKLRGQLEDLFHKELLCSHETFNESLILNSPQGRLIVPQIKEKLQNITTLMDCLTCEKCRVWGKLQTMGLATALKVVMLPPSTSVNLSRGEKVTLMNLLRQVTVSIHSLTTACSEGTPDEKGAKWDTHDGLGHDPLDL